MMPKLTEAQWRGLKCVATVPQTSRSIGGLNVARALERRGLVVVTRRVSYLPEVWSDVAITDAGRAALAAKGGGK